ncbi:MAG: hypothetical protein C0619_09065 [Desulfuromonas sp.]|nr:MAG: hypothetical protein C0619_09065 [Desulfuromonas sp.]
MLIKSIVLPEETVESYYTSLHQEFILKICPASQQRHSFVSANRLLRIALCPGTAKLNFMKTLEVFFDYV